MLSNVNSNVEDGNDIILDAVVEGDNDSSDKENIVFGPEKIQVYVNDQIRFFSFSLYMKVQKEYFRSSPKNGEIVIV